MLILESGTFVRRYKEECFSDPQHAPLEIESPSFMAKKDERQTLKHRLIKRTLNDG